VSAARCYGLMSLICFRARPETSLASNRLPNAEQKPRNSAPERAAKSPSQGSRRVPFWAKADTLLVQLPQNPAALHIRDPDEGRDRRGIQRPFVPPARVSQCNKSCSRQTPQQLGILVDPTASRAQRRVLTTFSSLGGACGQPTDLLRLRFRRGWPSLQNGSHGGSGLGMRQRLVADTFGSASSGGFALSLEYPSIGERRLAGEG
jgi:hypothetical protein